jgi:hypothetical protein
MDSGGRAGQGCGSEQAREPERVLGVGQVDAQVVARQGAELSDAVVNAVYSPVLAHRRLAVGDATLGSTSLSRACARIGRQNCGHLVSGPNGGGTGPKQRPAQAAALRRSS